METMTAEQALEAAKGITFEKAWAILMEENNRRNEEYNRRDEENKRRDEENRRWDEERKRRDEEDKRKDEESRIRIEESWARMEKTNEDFRKSMEKTISDMEKNTEKMTEELRANTEKVIGDLSKNLGGLGNSIGSFVETMFAGEIWKKFEELGISVSSQCENKYFKKDGRKVAEVDVFVENGDCAIIVEIKFDLVKKHIDEHLERIRVVRRCLDDRGDTRKLLGAVGGGTITPEAQQYAFDNGLYVFVQSGESVAIAKLPEDFKAQEW